MALCSDGRARRPTYSRALRPGAWCRLAAFVCAAVVFTVWPARPARAATSRDSRFQPNLEATVRYLQDAQREDGGFAEPGSEPGSDFTAWVALALAAAGINPRDQTTAKQHWTGGQSAYSYLAEHAHEASVTLSFERELLVVDATGTSPQDFGGVNLVNEILSRQLPQGSEAGGFHEEASDTEATMNDTIFAIIALSPIHEQAVQAAVARAAQWLESQQDCDGSWHTISPRAVKPCGTERRLLPGEASGEVDMTGAAIQALNAAGHPDPKGQENAFAFLHENQTANGGFREFPSEKEPNVASTAWVIQAMWSAGINPETLMTHSGLASEEPLGYLASMQQPDGHIRWEASQEANGMWMTGYVTPAFTGNPLPIPAPPPEELPPSPPEEHSTSGGNGGVSTNPGSGVIAGGGGNGAPLFSRPQPGSKGHTPGGVRQLTSKHKQEKTEHRRNPGPPRKTPVLTAVTASVHHAEKHDPASHKGTGGVALTGTSTGGGGHGSGQDVKGILIGAPTDALAPGAPGLHGAAAGENQSSWLAIGIAAAALALALLGALVELRRPQVIM
ncbi:MAG TPA: prenyltransferase/squalene oxidase repeat-containing protein [Solirubrobacteraceae bacterium]|jgi:prenyltransferase beta subunit|nr:prenyltransferase/squalene oxidase repeat-containing protein [Solirubrobacteraceae bacterium]